MASNASGGHTMFGNLPAYALYCRHVAGLTLSNVKFQANPPEAREALVLDDVQETKGPARNAAAKPR